MKAKLSVLVTCLALAMFAGCDVERQCLDVPSKAWSSKIARLIEAIENPATSWIEDPTWPRH